MTEPIHKTAAAAFLERLKGGGFRLTAQRETLFRVVAETLGTPSSVQDIWEKSRALDPSIGIATVYRTINLLEEMGVLNIIYLNEGEFRLEMPGQKLHVSAFCRRCGRLSPLGGEAEKQKIVEEWLEEAGMELLPQSLAVAGLCEECRAVMEDEDGPHPGMGRGRGGMGRCMGMGRGRMGRPGGPTKKGPPVRGGPSDSRS